ncbi:hypothetical protein [Sphingobacterium tabacisoli]|uniref:Uncharacterized protein n=1 Tax=Sphingobacterium tabacisoli TaxID=2044855 RepID=A0ABW5L5C0_9SPHI|nr:hypothetical protein [Sphingobacterium tabacisoli]
MSYDIALFRIETKEKEEISTHENFFDGTDNLLPFTEQQHLNLKQRLLSYDYILAEETDTGLRFNHKDEDFGQALLTMYALYFTAAWNKDSIFEVGMVASEFTDTGEYAKYDFQNGEWELWD